jgi:hypothetical protein
MMVAGRWTVDSPLEIAIRALRASNRTTGSFQTFEQMKSIVLRRFDASTVLVDRARGVPAVRSDLRKNIDGLLTTTSRFTAVEPQSA